MNDKPISVIFVTFIVYHCEIPHTFSPFVKIRIAEIMGSHAMSNKPWDDGAQALYDYLKPLTGKYAVDCVAGFSTAFEAMLNIYERER